MLGHSLTRRHLVTAVAACVLGSVLVASSAPNAAAATRPVGPLSPSSGALFGAYAEPPSGDTVAELTAAVSTLETDLGRTLDIATHFYNWNEAFPTALENGDKSKGRIPLISWGGTDVNTINSGSQDTMIRARADAMKAWGPEYFLRWFPDMNASSKDALTRTPSAFVTAWRRIYNTFQSRGATNAVFVWCPNAYGFTTGEALPYYPGDAYVDWVCADGYNWAPGQAGAAWKTFGQIFTDFYDWAAARTKPAMIGEAGVQEGDTATDKSAWIAGARSVMKTSFPEIQAFVYTHAIRSGYDWRANTSTASYNAFKAMAKDPYFYKIAGGTLLGAYVKPTSWSQTGVKNAITGFESKLGRKLDIDHHYHPWTAEIPTWMETWDAAEGRIPFISWNPPDNVGIITNGSQDAFLRARADEFKAMNKPVIIRWFYEADMRPEITHTPSSFIAAWRRIHDIFKSRGVTNVKWAWCMTAYGFTLGESQTYYPGDAYVDWICADGYNWAPGKPEAKWTAFESIFRNFYAWGTAKSKPLMVAETGVMERNTGEKAAWITDMRNDIKTVYPRIQALVWLQAIASSYTGGSYDWRVDTTTPSFSAFKALAADPVFSPDHADLI